MKKITFETNNSIGHIELPDDAKNIKLPQGACQDCDEPEPLTHEAIGIYEELDDQLPHGAVPVSEEEPDNDHRIAIPGGEETDDEHLLLPNIE